MTEEEFTEKVRIKVARAEYVKRALIVVTTALVSAVLVMSYFTMERQGDTIKAIRATQTHGSPILLAVQDAIDASVKTNEQIADCLEPSGDCYQRSQNQQAVFYYALVCLDRPGTMTLPALRVCVDDLFGEEGSDVR